MTPAILRNAFATAISALALASCTSTQPVSEASDAPRRPVSVDAEGVVPDYCPRISLREGTAILRKGLGEEMQYIASITQTTRECHVVDGELRIKVGVSGRVVSGPAGQSGTATLPIRVAVVSGQNVLYANKGTQGVAFAPGVPNRFVYVDEMIRVPEPSAKNYSIFVGFDEGK